MTRDDAFTWLKSRGYVFKGKNAYLPDRPDRRYVVNDLILRYEEKAGVDHWVMTRHGYYGQMSITSENKLSGFKPWHL